MKSTEKSKELLTILTEMGIRDETSLRTILIEMLENDEQTQFVIEEIRKKGTVSIEELGEILMDIY